MRIFIDADGCPVVDVTIDVAKRFGLDCVIICDTSHVFEREGVQTITVDKGADQVDFKLVNMLDAGDIVITQDYGLAAMCLARRAIPISQNGLMFHEGNMDGLLMKRDIARKVRKAGGRMRGPAKRTKEDDQRFEFALVAALRARI